MNVPSERTQDSATPEESQATGTTQLGAPGQLPATTVAAGTPTAPKGHRRKLGTLATIQAVMNDIGRVCVVTIGPAPGRFSWHDPGSKVRRIVGVTGKLRVSCAAHAGQATEFLGVLDGLLQVGDNVRLERTGTR